MIWIVTREWIKSKRRYIIGYFRFRNIQPVIFGFNATFMNNICWKRGTTLNLESDRTLSCDLLHWAYSSSDPGFSSIKINLNWNIVWSKNINQTASKTLTFVALISVSIVPPSTITLSSDTFGVGIAFTTFVDWKQENIMFDTWNMFLSSYD